MRVTRALRLALAAAAHAALAAAAPLPPHALFWSPLGEPGCGGDIVSARIDPFNTSRIYISGDMLGVGVSLDSGEVRPGAWARHCTRLGAPPLKRPLPSATPPARADLDVTRAHVLPLVGDGRLYL